MTDLETGGQGAPVYLVITVDWHLGIDAHAYTHRDTAIAVARETVTRRAARDEHAPITESVPPGTLLYLRYSDDGELDDSAWVVERRIGDPIVDPDCDCHLEEPGPPEMIGGEQCRPGPVVTVSVEISHPGDGAWPNHGRKAIYQHVDIPVDAIGGGPDPVVEALSDVVERMAGRWRGVRSQYRQAWRDLAAGRE